MTSLRDHFRRGPAHWNEFIDSYECETINFQGGTFKKDPLDLSGYNFPLPVSFTDCTFKGAVRIEAVEFESWVDFVGATFEKPVLLKDSTFDGQVDFESARFKESL